MKDVRELGTELDRLRVAAGLSTAELARQAGIGQGNVSLYLRGERIPGVKNFRRLADVLGMDAKAWLPAIVQYQRDARRRISSKEIPAEEQNEGGFVPRAKTPNEIRLIQVSRAAKRAGMSYGQFIATHSEAEIKRLCKEAGIHDKA